MAVTEELIGHMRHAQKAERDLHDLGTVWQLIECSAAISCPDEVAPLLPALARTRERFEDLMQRLVEQIVCETRDALGDELDAKARCAIDILVRNLSQRTADVSLLATDDTLRHFCAADATTRGQTAAALRRRLAEYQAKYTVYDDIVLLSPQGEVLARLSGTEEPSHSHDPLIARASQRDGPVESFGPSDLGPSGQAALLYAHRVHSPQGAVAGVLVLRFRFADEMRRIFDSMADDRHEMAIVLLDAEQRVIASSDEAHIPLGAQLPPAAQDRVALSSFGGREYLIMRCAGHPYQGYTGPGWQAQAMVSLLTAFRAASAPPAAAEVNGVPTDAPELLTVQHDARAINRELRRVVWNGRLMAGDHQGDRLRLKSVLRQVSLAGGRTRERLEQAIGDLSRTSLARTQRQAREMAQLAVDSLDRCLYERANDVRWWALSPLLREALAAPADASNARALDNALDGIHRLYPVYSRLVVFDAQGRVRGVSRRPETALGQAASSTSSAAPGAALPTTVPSTWLQATRQLADAQRYTVTPFEDTALHEAGPTYTYLAAVHAGSTQASFVGGIALLLDAPAELGTMLRHLLAERSGVAAFLDGHGNLLCASDPVLAAAVLPQALRGPTVTEVDGVHYACVVTAARGYREFGLRNALEGPVRQALIALRVGTFDRRRFNMAEAELQPIHPGRPTDTLELALCHVGPMRYGLPAAAVLEALSPERVVNSRGPHPAITGMVEVQHGDGREPARMVHVVSARRLFGLHSPPRAGDGVLLVLRDPHSTTTRPAFALQVDDVINVIDTAAAGVHPAEAAVQRMAAWIDGVVDCTWSRHGEQHEALVQRLSVDALMATLRPVRAAA